MTHPLFLSDSERNPSPDSVPVPTCSPDRLLPFLSGLIPLKSLWTSALLSRYHQAAAHKLGSLVLICILFACLRVVSAASTYTFTSTELNSITYLFSQDLISLFILTRFLALCSVILYFKLRIISMELGVICINNCVA